MSLTTTHRHLPLLTSLMDPTFGIPPDVTFQIMVMADHQEVGCQVEERLLGEVKGHQMLLGLFSPVFKKEFYGPAKETTDIIPVRQTSLESFERMFDYIYNKAIEWGDVRRGQASGEVPHSWVAGCCQESNGECPSYHGGRD